MTKKGVKDSNDVTIFPVRNSYRNHTEKSSIICSHRNKGGHDSKSCFQVISYLDWWLEKNKQKSNIGGRRVVLLKGRNRGRGRNKRWLNWWCWSWESTTSMGFDSCCTTINWRNQQCLHLPQFSHDYRHIPCKLFTRTMECIRLFHE